MSSSHYAQLRMPLEIITGDTPDISEHLDFSFYDWVKYHQNAGLGEPLTGRWLGVSHKVGQLMSYWILTSKGRVISCTTVQRLTYAESQTDDIKKACDSFDAMIADAFDAKNVDNSKNMNEHPHWNRLSIDDFETDQKFIDEFRKVINNEDISEADDVYTTMNDASYTQMELGLPRGPDDQL